MTPGEVLLDTNIVAAASLHTGVTLVSRDGHFAAVENLTVLAW
jgi:predicted nucleic acid-binding protein